jgi:hypothetical protein
LAAILIVSTLALTACWQTVISFPPVDEVTSLGMSCSEIYQAQIDAWISEDPEKLRSVYTEDIVHFDGAPLFVGIDEVLVMANRMFRAFPNWQMKAGQTYISKEECFGTWMFWDTGGLKEDDPGLEFDLLETRNGRISFWRLFYDHHFDSERIDEDLLTTFAAAWSKGTPDQAAGLYSQEAVLEDTLFGVTVEGQSAVEKYARDLLKNHPGISWELIYSFAEDDFANSESEILASKGGVFSIFTTDEQGDPCQVQAALILTPDLDGRIQHQKTFYEVDSLLDCGWVK